MVRVKNTYVRSNPQLEGIMQCDRITYSSLSSSGWQEYHSSIPDIFRLHTSAFRLHARTDYQTRNINTVPYLKVYICLSHPDSQFQHTYCFNGFYCCDSQFRQLMVKIVNDYAPGTYNSATGRNSKLKSQTDLNTYCHNLFVYLITIRQLCSL